jgi:hypothetical protein
MPVDPHHNHRKLHPEGGLREGGTEIGGPPQSLQFRLWSTLIEYHPGHAEKCTQLLMLLIQMLENQNQH